MRYLNYRPANGFKRLVAFLIDLIPIYLVLLYFSMSIYQISPVTVGPVSANQLAKATEAKILLNVASFMVWILYCLVAELTPWRGTFGKRLMNLKVKSIRDSKPTVRQVILRNLFKLVSMIPLYAGFVVAFFTHGNRAWHDMVSGLVVAEDR